MRHADRGVDGPLVAVVGIYYGYRARRGAVGVGAATVRSMVVNLVRATFLNTLATAVFFTHLRVPIGG